EILGELSLLDRGLRSASAVALEPTSGCFFGNRNFEVLRAGFRPAAFKVMRHINAMLCRRIRDVCGEIAELEYSIMPPSIRSPSGISRASQRPDDGSPTTVRIDALRAIPFFRQFSERELEGLLAIAEVRCMPSGQVLIEQVDGPGSCFVGARGPVQK